MQTSPEREELVREMWQAQAHVRDIAAAIHSSSSTVYDIAKKLRLPLRGDGRPRVAKPAPPPEIPEAWQNPTGIPIDTRTLSGRVFGDPLPGRSALDRRQPSGQGSGL